MKKVFLGILLGGFGLVAAFVVSILIFTAGLTDIADDFFAAAAEEDFGKAQEFLSKKFLEVTPEEDFKLFLKRSALTKVEDISWMERGRHNNTGTVRGRVTTSVNKEFNITMEFIKEGSEWKILAIEKEGTKTPGLAAQKILAADVMTEFVKGATKRDMSDFRKTTAQAWQKSTTGEDFDRFFGTFFNETIDLTPVENQIPELDGLGEKGKDGVLLIKGSYPEPISGNTLTFEQRFLAEGEEWKLIGLKVDLS